jgi:hypothetical protein
LHHAAHVGGKQRRFGFLSPPSVRRMPFKVSITAACCTVAGDR